MGELLTVKKSLKPFLFKLIILISIPMILNSCLPTKSTVSVNFKKNSIKESLSITISNIKVVSNQIIITGTNLNSVSNFKIKEGTTQTALQIESKTNTSLVANTISNVTFAVGKVFDFILSNAHGASTFTVDFSLCDANLGGKNIACLVAPTDKQVLSYDGNSDTWRPRSVNGLSYKGVWSSLPAFPPAGALVPGDYFIVSVANGVYNVGDWIVLNDDGVTFEQIENSVQVKTVFGRNADVVAAENDYQLDLLGDVDLSAAPMLGDALIYNGSKWIAGPVSGGGGSGAPTGAAGGDLAGTYPNPIVGPNKITDTHIANGAISQTKINGLATSLSGKEPAITAAATTTYFRGDKTFVTLDTSVVPEGSRLYFTNARALGILLAGFDNSLTGQVSAGDTMLQGFGRLQNQINSLGTDGSNHLVKNGSDTISGTVSLTNVITATGAGDIVVNSVPLTMTSAVNKTYADGKLDKTTGGVVAGVVTLDNDLKIKSGSNYVTIKGNAATAGDYNFVLPTSAGTAGYFLSTDGNGNTSWVSAGGGGAPTGAATGDLGGSYPAPTVATVGGVTAVNIATGVNLANAATNANTANTIVKRDASGNFTATNVSGVVAVANGGTGKTTLGLNNLLFGNATSAVGEVVSTTTPSVLLSADTTGLPTWTTSTAGNVLKGSVTGVAFGPLDLSDLPAGTLSGAGTVNYVPYYNTTTTLANSPMAVSGSSVGIGTTAPDASLHIVGASGTTLKLVDGNQAAGKMLVSDANGVASWQNLSIDSFPNFFMVNKVRVATGGDIVLSGLQTIDNVALNDGDRVLVKKQTNAQDNGVYLASAGAWTRASDMNTWDSTIGYKMFVLEGQSNQGSEYVSNTALGGTLGTTSITFGTIATSNAITALGRSALSSNTTGLYNTGIGYGVLSANTTSSFNTAIGYGALNKSTTGSGANIAIGVSTMSMNTTGFYNTAVGTNSLQYNDTGYRNTAVGYLASRNATTGSYNTSLGYSALRYNLVGTRITAIGESALENSTGNSNIGLGSYAGSAIQTGNYNVVIGSNTGSSIDGMSNQIIIADGQGNARIRVDNLGNVGIGTTTPGAPLDVKGSIRMSGATSGYTGFQPAAVAGSTVWTLPAADGSPGQILKTDGAGILSWVNDNSGGGAFTGAVSRAVATDGAGALTTVTTTATELDYVSGVTSNIQAQLNAKQASGNYVTALTGDVTATGPGSVAATVATVGGVTAANVAAGVNLANAATNLNTASTIVKRDASGNFSAGTITATLNGTATNVSGTVAVANGGTGSTTAAGARTNLGLGTAALANTGSSINQLPLLGANATVGSMCTFDLTLGFICNTAIPTGNASTANPLSQFAATTSAQLAGVLSNETGSGLAVFNTAPTFLTNLTAPLIIGGTSSTSSLIYRTTSGVGASGADHIFQVGNNGATEAMRILNNGNVGVGTSTPGSKLEVAGQIKITGGVPGAGKVLTSDAAGLATWETLISGATNLNGLSDADTPGTTSIFLGMNAGDAAVTGQQNTGVGINSLNVVSSGGFNTALGYNSMKFMTTGSGNTALGASAMENSVSTSESTAIGQYAMSSAVGTSKNTAIGYAALSQVTSGYNIGIGDNVLKTATSGDNIAIGNFVLISATSAGQNTVVGNNAFQAGTTGDFNTIIGYRAGYNNGTGALTSGSDNILIGRDVITPAPTTSSHLNIGNAIFGDLTTGNVGIGINAPGAKLEVAGQIKITGGTPGAGKILTSDATGLATWQTPAGGGTVTGVTATAPVVSSGGTAPVISMAAATTSVPGYLTAADWTTFNAKAPLASPTFTGVPLAPTAAVNTNTTQLATTAFVVGQAGTANPLMNSTVAVGTSLLYSRQDHVHPVDTSRAPAAGSASITTLGTITAGVWNATTIALANGGTGATTAAGARTNLGLGTAAVANTGALINQLPLLGANATAGSMCTYDLVLGFICNTAIPTGTGDFMKDGSVAMTGALKVPDGTSSAPSIAFSSDTNTGFYKDYADSFAITANGTTLFSFGNGAMIAPGVNAPKIYTTPGTAAAPTYTFNGVHNSGMFAPGGQEIAFSTDSVERLRIDSVGNVGIGVTSPQAKLHVDGTMASSLINDTTPTAFDMSLGNYQYTSTGCSGATWTLNNLVQGTSYTIAVQNNTHTGTCSFSDGSSTFKYRPANAMPGGGHVIYTFTKMGSFVYVSWIEGF